VYRDATLVSAEQKLRNVSRARDPLFGISGMGGGLGSFIELKVQPRVIYICIKKRVQQKALKMLAERIIQHAKGAPTRIILRRSHKGKYTYGEWASTKALSKMDAKALYDRLIKATKKRTKYITLILKQKRVGGAIHEAIKKTRSLI
jgi:hypothetical protein